jgi:hypothetical protein
LEIRFNLFVQIFPQRSENIALCILEKKWSAGDTDVLIRTRLFVFYDDSQTLQM